MKAAILAVGDELTSGLTADTNSAWLAARLRTCGCAVLEMRAVPDDRASIARAVADLAACHNLLCITGGLGPTPDDLTRDALGDVVRPGEELETDAGALAEIAGWFEKGGRAMPAMNARQAQRPRGASMLANDRGTAPGIELSWNRCLIIAMPGVPAEMKPMFERFAKRRLHGDPLVVRSVHTFGIGESDLAARLGDLLARGRSPQLGTAAGGGVVSVRGYATAAQAADLEQLLAEVERGAGPYVFGRDDATLAGSLAELLVKSNRRLATAESCTGGLLGALLTEVEGSSRWYVGGWITYSNAMKKSDLDVPRELIDRRGAVSPEVAAAMAFGALHRSGADIALAVTGIAGPTGGRPDKPAGSVFISCAQRREKHTEARTRHFRFVGEREAVRRWAALTALQIARLTLLGFEPATPLLREVRPLGGILARSPSQAWIALGSNLGDREQNIRSALRSLTSDGSVRLRAVSPLVETDPVGPGPQPKYLNGAAEVVTTLSPRQLLDQMLEVERECGRDRSEGERHGPRTIDLDLLLFEDQAIEEPGLTVPHPRMHERSFVLRPLAEIAGDRVHPVLGVTIRGLLGRLEGSPNSD